MNGPHLTKSRYVAGLQCPRRLWLLVNDPPPYDTPAPGSPMDIVRQIGLKARLLFPGGALVGEEPWRHEEAVARTASLMADEGRTPFLKLHSSTMAPAFGYAFLTTEANAEFAPIHPEAMPVIMTDEGEGDVWLNAPTPVAMELQRPLADGKLKIVARRECQDVGT